MRIKADRNIAANYFPQESGEYLVKCALVEDNGDTLMDITFTTASKDHARKICGNWKKNPSVFYRGIMEMLLGQEPV
jgi:hypothetical protein